MTDAACIALKRSALETYFHTLNDRQREAVFAIKGPTLVLAGAGSGKTTAIIHRIINMIYFGDAYAGADGVLFSDDATWLSAYVQGDVPCDLSRLREILAVQPIRPWNILAITFTNKAAGEMRVRLAKAIGEEEASQAHVATFHSTCMRILRRSISLLGFRSDFVIYDTDDTKRLLKSCLAELHISEKQFSPVAVLQEISMAKDAMISPEQMLKDAGGDYRRTMYAKIYAAYQKHLQEFNALDFDDIIYDTVDLFRRFPDELETYQNRYRYVLVDEYQDTNHAQYELISLLTQKNRNLCVVGDDDQSIYRFRGATIANILGFERQFPDCRVIRLEQNYRSTERILDAANNVIANNEGRKEKHLWTQLGGGEKILWYKARDERDEAAYVVSLIQQSVENGGNYQENAVLYRMNAQSAALQGELMRQNIPYKVYGGRRITDSKEIRDIHAYMCIVENPNDMVRFQRVVNAPKRGIGNATISRIQDIASDLGLAPLEVLRDAESYPVLSKKAATLKRFAEMWETLISASEKVSLLDFLEVLLDETGYRAALEEKGEEGERCLAKIEEQWKPLIEDYENDAESPSLGDFLEKISLYMDTDKYEPQEDKVTLMTVHSAKGLEFENVYLPGMEQGIFPSMRSLDTQEDLEEERRLAYVALTRAKKNLTISTAASRCLFGTTMRNLPSQFLKEIDESLLEKKESTTQYGRRSGSMIHRSETSRSISLQKQMTQKKKKTSSVGNQFHVGERILHKKFGAGTVLSIQEMAGDAMLEVGFDTYGTKKIMANYTHLQKLS